MRVKRRNADSTQQATELQSGVAECGHPECACPSLSIPCISDSPLGAKNAASTTEPPRRFRNSTCHPSCRASSSAKRSRRDSNSSGSPETGPRGYTTSSPAGPAAVCSRVVVPAIRCRVSPAPRGEARSCCLQNRPFVAGLPTGLYLPYHASGYLPHPLHPLLQLALLQYRSKVFLPWTLSSPPSFDPNSPQGRCSGGGRLGGTPGIKLRVRLPLLHDAQGHHLHLSNSLPSIQAGLVRQLVWSVLLPSKATTRAN